MQYLVDGDRVVLYYRLTFTARASGKSVEMGVPRCSHYATS